MVLERLINIRTALKDPFSMFMVGALIATASLIISFVVFSESIGMFTTILITMAMTPFMVNLLYHEEIQTELEIVRKQTNILNRHFDVISIYTSFFLGTVLALSVIFILLPGPIVEHIFSDQISEINIIRGNFITLDRFERIVINNIGVLMMSFLFSFLFGSGAIFILSWNATVLSTAIGLAAKSIGGIYGLPLAVMIFFPHGSLEILAYFIGAISGGIISATVTKRNSKVFWDIIADSFKLLAVALVLLLVAGIVESAQL